MHKESSGSSNQNPLFKWGILAFCFSFVGVFVHPALFLVMILISFGIFFLGCLKHIFAKKSVTCSACDGSGVSKFKTDSCPRLGTSSSGPVLKVKYEGKVYSITWRKSWILLTDLNMVCDVECVRCQPVQELEHMMYRPDGMSDQTFEQQSNWPTAVSGLQPGANTITSENNLLANFLPETLKDVREECNAMRPNSLS